MPEKPPDPTRSAARSRRAWIAAAVLLAAVVVASVARDRLPKTADREAPAPAEIAFEPIGHDGAFPEPLVVGDVDGDGFGDAIRSVAPVAQMFFGRGDGTFDLVGFPFSGPTAPPLAAINLDHDRRTDFFVPLGGDESMVLSQYRFAPPIGKPYFRADGGVAPLPARGEALPIGDAGTVLREDGVFGLVANLTFPRPTPTDPYRVVGADIDGNGAADLFVQVVTQGLPPPAADPATAATARWPRFYSPEKGYFASADEAAAAHPPAPEPTPLARLHLNLVTQPGATPPRLQSRMVPLAASAGFDARRYVVLAADLDGDGRADLVRAPIAAEAGRDLLLYRSVPGGFIVTAADLRGAEAPPPGTAHFAPGDFDGDGRADLAVASGAGVSIWISRGENRLVAARAGGVDPTLAGSSTFPYAVDLDGDGHLDLIVQRRDGTPSVRLFRQAGRK